MTLFLHNGTDLFPLFFLLLSELYIIIQCNLYDATLIVNCLEMCLYGKWYKILCVKKNKTREIVEIWKSYNQHANITQSDFAACKILSKRSLKFPEILPKV